MIKATLKATILGIRMCSTEFLLWKVSERKISERFDLLPY